MKHLPSGVPKLTLNACNPSFGQTLETRVQLLKKKKKKIIKNLKKQKQLSVVRLSDLNFNVPVN